MFRSFVSTAAVALGVADKGADVVLLRCVEAIVVAVLLVAFGFALLA